MKVLCLMLMALPLAAQEKWVATWGTAQQQYRAGGGGRGVAPPTSAAPAPAAQPVPPPAAATGPARRFPVPPPLAGLNNQTVRMIVRTSIAGHTLRVRLANALGAPSVRLGAAHLAIRGKDAAIAAGSDRALSFSGSPTATIYAGQVLVSDPVTLDVPALTDLAVSLYFPGETGPPTSHTFGLRPAYVSTPGDFTGSTEIAEPAATMQSWYWVEGIDVLAPATAGTLVTFGDSITDGDQSTPDTNGAWPSLLARRLQANKATANIGVVNAGISGNRVLGDNNGGLARLLRDALTVPGVKWITVMEGINDITAATRPNAPPNATGQAFTAETLIAAYKQMIATAHLYGVKAIGCTMTPYGGATPYSEAGEAIRTAANEWIRTSGAFDAVIDFDAATRDSADPHRFRAAADSPDMLHPGDAGYRLMADAVNLSILTNRK
jgi:lysophospholipase L1-like esterase